MNGDNGVIQLLILFFTNSLIN
jgi:hypothetical protein